MRYGGGSLFAAGRWLLVAFVLLDMDDSASGEAARSCGAEVRRERLASGDHWPLILSLGLTK
jgi:hypothetical protein